MKRTRIKRTDKISNLKSDHTREKEEPKLTSRIDLEIHTSKNLNRKFTDWREMSLDEKIKIFKIKDKCDRCQKRNPVYFNFIVETGFPLVCCEECYPEIISDRENGKAVK